MKFLNDHIFMNTSQIKEIQSAKYIYFFSNFQIWNGNKKISNIKCLKFDQKNSYISTKITKSKECDDLWKKNWTWEIRKVHDLIYSKWFYRRKTTSAIKRYDHSKMSFKRGPVYFCLPCIFFYIYKIISFDLGGCFW